MASSRFLFNLLPYRPDAPTGLSRYVNHFLKAWSVATGEALPQQLRLRVDGVPQLAADAHLPQEQRSRRMRWLQANSLVQHAVPTGKLVAQADPAVIYSPYTDRLLGVRDRPQVITCHDLTPLYFPSSRRAFWRSRLWLPRHLNGATRVIAISCHVADLLVEEGLSAQRIIVIPNGVEVVVDPIHAPATRDVLLLARHARNKNIPLALRGFAQLLALEPQWEGNLVIVGGRGRVTAQLLQLERSLDLIGRVQWLPHLSEEDLERQLRSSFCLISTSLMEGFDYPLLEAQARGLPTLASRIPVHEELHKDAACQFDLDDEGVSLAVQIQRLARDSCLWKHLSQAGLINAQQFTLQQQTSSIHQLLSSLCLNR